MATRVEVTGVRAVVQALGDFDPETKKALRKVIYDALKVTSTAAKAEYPEGRWKVSVFGKTGGGMMALGSIGAAGGVRRNPWNTSDGGVRASIFEFAGSQSSSDRPQVKNMIASLNSRYGSPGRFLWDAWDSKGNRKLQEVEVAFREAERKLQAIMESGD